MEIKFELPENKTLREFLFDFTLIDFPISGGLGQSIDDAIIMKVTENNDFIRWEYRILENLFYIRSINYKLIEQSLIKDGDKKYDCILISYKKKGKFLRKNVLRNIILKLQNVLRKDLQTCGQKKTPWMTLFRILS